MSRTKIMIASTIFLAVTCIKFALPTTADMLRKELHTVMDQDTDIRAAMTTIGEKLADEETLVAALALLRPEQAAEPEPEAESVEKPLLRSETVYRPVSLAQMRAQRTDGLGKAPEPTQAEENLEAEEPTPEPQITPQAPVSPAVEQFLEAQSAYSDYAVPVGVSYAMPGLNIGYASPVSGMTSSGFGYRVHPITGEVKFHYGTDFAAWTGTEIRSFADGVVSVAAEDSGYGNYLIIAHNDGCETLYAHCSKLLVAAGETVSAGQLIAKVGETGQVTGPHLHFELKKDGQYLNPEYYVNQKG